MLAGLLEIASPELHVILLPDNLGAIERAPHDQQPGRCGAVRRVSAAHRRGQSPRRHPLDSCPEPVQLKLRLRRCQPGSRLSDGQRHGRARFHQPPRLPRLQVLLKLVEQYNSRVSCTSGLRSCSCWLSKNGMASPQHRGRRGSSDDKLFQGSQPALHPVCSRPGTSWIRRILECHVPFHTDSNEPLRCE